MWSLRLFRYYNKRDTTFIDQPRANSLIRCLLEETNLHFDARRRCFSLHHLFRAFLIHRTLSTMLSQANEQEHGLRTIFIKLDVLVAINPQGCFNIPTAVKCLTRPIFDA